MPGPTSVPQEVQNLLAGSAGAGASSLVPHSLQNFMPSSFAVPQLGQIFPAAAGAGAGISNLFPQF